MGALSGYVFIGVGLLFSVVSYYGNRMQDSNALTIFIYVGYLFIAYGFAKLGVKYILGKKDSSKKNLKKTSPLPPHVSQSAPNSSGENASGGQNRVSSPSPSVPRAPQHDSSSHVQSVHHSAHPTHTSGFVGHCRSCGTPMRAVNVFCHRCGLKQNHSSPQAHQPVHQHGASSPHHNHQPHNSSYVPQGSSQTHPSHSSYTR
ncbi:MAG: hypothetical protein ACMXYE_02870 [Candidatus Woesearchaeota archaeon]